ncbi:MAG: hypothetical protein V7609_2916 [Verrucomicrobiota bacterium]
MTNCENRGMVHESAFTLVHYQTPRFLNPNDKFLDSTIAVGGKLAQPRVVKRRSKISLFTAGYEGLALPDFLRQLKAASVEVLFDIRYRPQSRKPGFSKNKLAAACKRRGIRYLHDPKLGTPPDQMAAMKEAGEYTPQIFKRYRRFLLKQVESLETAVEVASKENTCLLCYERDYRTCHRKIVAEEITLRTGLPVTHLRAEEIVT